MTVLWGGQTSGGGGVPLSGSLGSLQWACVSHQSRDRSGTTRAAGADWVTKGGRPPVERREGDPFRGDGPDCTISADTAHSLGSTPPRGSDGTPEERGTDGRVTSSRASPESRRGPRNYSSVVRQGSHWVGTRGVRLQSGGELEGCLYRLTGSLNCADLL